MSKLLPSSVPYSFTVAVGLALVSGCSTMKHLYAPHEAAAEEREAKEQKELAAYPDGECNTAESCKYRCEKLQRALDCYKTGKAAMRGVDVHYAGGWKVEKVSGSTEDIRVHHEADSEEHASLMPLAQEAFGLACDANHGESCRILGTIIGDHDQPRTNALLTKACTLHDQKACELVSAKR